MKRSQIPVYNFGVSERPDLKFILYYVNWGANAV